MKNLLSAGIVLTGLLAPIARSQECNPVDFLLKDTDYGTWSESVKLAFLNSATEEQYKKVQDQWKTGGSYGPISGYFDYGSAREMASRHASLTHIDYSHDDYGLYLQQKLSPLGASAYSECLTSSKSSPGLRLWLVKREGDFYTLRTFWVGDSNQAKGSLDQPPQFSDLEIKSMPKEWPKGEVRDILVKKSPDADAFLSLTVSGHTKHLVLLKNLRTVPYARTTIYGNLVTATSGGNGKSPNCGGHCAQTLQSCVTPQHGGYLVPDSVAAAEVETVGSVARADVTMRTLDRACVDFVSTTTAKEVYVVSGGRVSVAEVYPVVQSHSTAVGSQ